METAMEVVDQVIRGEFNAAEMTQKQRDVLKDANNAVQAAVAEMNGEQFVEQNDEDAGQDPAQDEQDNGQNEQEEEQTGEVSANPQEDKRTDRQKLRDAARLYKAVNKGLKGQYAETVEQTMVDAIKENAQSREAEVTDDQARMIIKLVDKLSLPNVEVSDLSRRERALYNSSDAIKGIINDLLTESDLSTEAARRVAEATRDKARQLIRLNQMSDASVQEHIAEVNARMSEIEEAADEQLTDRMGVDEDGQQVEVMSVNPDGTVNVVDQDGKSEAVHVDEVTWNTRTAAVLTYAVERLSAMTRQRMNTLINTYDGRRDVAAFIRDFEHIYNAGYIGAELESGSINEDVASQIYDVAVSEAAAAEEARQNALKAFARKNNEKRSGTVTMAEGVEEKLNEAAKEQVKLFRAIAESVGINIHLTADETVDEYGRLTGENGHFTLNDDGTVGITLDIYANFGTLEQAKRSSETLMARTLGHELTHFMEAYSADAYQRMVDVVTQTMGMRDFDNAVTELMGDRGMTYNAAISEVVADAYQDVLSDSAAIRQMFTDAQTADAAGSFMGKLFSRIKNALKNVALNHTTGRSRAAARLQAMVDGMYSYTDNAVRTWDEAFREARYNYDAFKESMDIEPVQSMEGTLAPTPEEVTEGERPAVIEMPEQTVQESARTYRETGRDKLIKTLQHNGYTENQIKRRLAFMDKVADQMDKWAVKYHYVNLQEVNNATLTRARGGGWTMTCVVPNAEYPINIDFSTICKKRRDMTDFFNALAKDRGEDGRNALDRISLTPENIKSINDILKQAGYETACFGCFVEAKRYDVKKFADQFVSMWNGTVDSIRSEYGLPAAERFDLSDGHESSAEELDQVEKALSNYNASGKKAIYKVAKSGKVDARIRSLLVESIRQEQRDGTNNYPLLRHLDVSDIVTSDGMERMAKEYKEIQRILASHWGQKRPKDIRAYVPYNSEIADFKMTPKTIGSKLGLTQLAVDAMVQQEKDKGLKDSEANSAVMDKLLPMYIASIGGVRNQSFSDFIATQMYDALQMIADCEARGFTGQCYTKEASRAWLLGSTHFKTNLSVMFLIDKNVDAAHAGLNADGSYRIADYEHIQRDNPDWRDDPTMQPQSIGWRDAVEIETNADRADTCGIIGVGHSYHHIMKMLNDYYVPYAIPYHRSGLPVDIAERTNIIMSADYTDVQNTVKMPEAFEVVTNPESFDAPTYATWSIGVKKKTAKWNGITPAEFVKADLKKTGSGVQTMQNLLTFMAENNLTLKKGSKSANGHGDFDVYGTGINRYSTHYSGLAENGNPKVTADNYISWCLSRNTLPLFYEFADNQNYFKMLYDFSTLDLTKIDRTKWDAGYYAAHPEALAQAYAPQVPVSMDRLLTKSGTQEFIDRADGALGYEDRRAQQLFGEPSNRPEVFRQTAEAIRNVGRTQQSVGRESGMTVEDIIRNIDPTDGMSASTADFVRAYRERMDKYDQLNQQRIEQMQIRDNPAYTQEQRMQARNRVSILSGQMTRAMTTIDAMRNMHEYGTIRQEAARFIRNYIIDKTGEQIASQRDEITEQLKAISETVEKLNREVETMRENGWNGDVLERVVSKEKLLNAARQTRYRYFTSMTNEQLMNKYKRLFVLLASGKSEQYMKAVQEFAQEIMDTYKANRNSTHSYTYDAVSGSVVSLTSRQLQEMKHAGMTITSLNEALRPLNITVSKNGISLDEKWVEWAESSGAVNADTNEGDQLKELLMMAAHEEENARSIDMGMPDADLMQQILMDINTNVGSLSSQQDIISGLVRLNREFKAGKTDAQQLAADIRQFVESASDLIMKADSNNERILRMSGSDVISLADMDKMLAYYNTLEERYNSIRSMETLRRDQTYMDSNGIQNVLEERQKWMDRMQRDRAMRKLTESNAGLRNRIGRDTKRIWKRLVQESDRDNVPETSKWLAMKTVDLISAWDMLRKNNEPGLAWDGVSATAVTDRLRLMFNDSDEYQFTDDQQELIEDLIDRLAAAKKVVMTPVGNAEGQYDSNYTKAVAYNQAFNAISETVSDISSMISSDRYLFILGQRVRIDDYASEMFDRLNEMPDHNKLDGVIGEAVSGLDRFARYGNMTPVYFFRTINDEGLTGLYRGLCDGENSYGLRLAEAQEKLHEIRAKYADYTSWANDDRTFDVNDGKNEVKLNTMQALSLYATWKREHADTLINSQHLEKGGIVIREKAKGLVKRQAERSIGVKFNDFAALEQWLTEDQKKYVDDIVSYLSSDIAVWGNEASIAALGIRKYKEQYYFPIKSVGEATRTTSLQSPETRYDRSAIKRSFTNRRVQSANNALLIEDFDSVAESHIHGMAVYSCFSMPIMMFDRVLNYQYKATENAEIGTRIRQMISQKLGKDAMNYLDTWLYDLNGGAV